MGVPIDYSIVIALAFGLALEISTKVKVSLQRVRFSLGRQRDRLHVGKLSKFSNLLLILTLNSVIVGVSK